MNLCSTFNMIHSPKEKLIETDLKTIEIMELAGDGVKTGITNMLHMFRNVDEQLNMIRRDVKNTKRPK